MPSRMRLLSVRIQGYRPFKDFQAPLGDLEVCVGANGSGKSSLFEFLRFLRDGVRRDIPPEIVAGSIGQNIFHLPGPERFLWDIEIDTGRQTPIVYQGEVVGPIGKTHVASELVRFRVPLPPEHKGHHLIFMDVQGGEGSVHDAEDISDHELYKISLARPNQLALSTMTNPTVAVPYDLREYVSDWKFYSSFNISNEKIRKSVPLEQEPVLHEDAGNLSSLLHYLMTEHERVFDELQQHLRAAVPGFERLSVKARGGPGEVIAFWREEGVEQDLSLADLSDGILRLLCWAAICLQPNPPPLICIDEPDQGVHPRTLPILAGLFEKASERTQLLLATHASYFLMQFNLSRIAVFRKQNGEAQFIKPENSKILKANLEDFGDEEIQLMHRSDELELLA